MGWEVTSVGLSVVPAIVIFSQGRKKITLPSLVAGSSRPMLSGLKKKGCDSEQIRHHQELFLYVFSYYISTFAPVQKELTTAQP